MRSLSSTRHSSSPSSSSSSSSSSLSEDESAASSQGAFLSEDAATVTSQSSSSLVHSSSVFLLRSGVEAVDAEASSVSGSETSSLAEAGSSRLRFRRRDHSGVSPGASAAASSDTNEYTRIMEELSSPPPGTRRRHPMQHRLALSVEGPVHDAGNAEVVSSRHHIHHHHHHRRENKGVTSTSYSRDDTDIHYHAAGDGDLFHHHRHSSRHPRGHDRRHHRRRHRPDRRHATAPASRVGGAGVHEAVHGGDVEVSTRGGAVTADAQSGNGGVDRLSSGGVQVRGSNSRAEQQVEMDGSFVLVEAPPRPALLSAQLVASRSPLIRLQYEARPPTPPATTPASSSSTAAAATQSARAQSDEQQQHQHHGHPKYLSSSARVPSGSRSGTTTGGGGRSRASSPPPTPNAPLSSSASASMLRAQRRDRGTSPGLPASKSASVVGSGGGATTDTGYGTQSTAGNAGAAGIDAASLAAAVAELATGHTGPMTMAADVSVQLHRSVSRAPSRSRQPSPDVSSSFPAPSRGRSAQRNVSSSDRGPPLVEGVARKRTAFFLHDKLLDKHLKRLSPRFPVVLKERLAHCIMPDVHRTSWVRLNAVHAVFRLLPRLSALSRQYAQGYGVSSRRLMRAIADAEATTKHQVEIIFHYHLGIILARVSQFVSEALKIVQRVSPVHMEPVTRYLQEIIAQGQRNLSPTVFALFYERLWRRVFDIALSTAVTSIDALFRLDSGAANRLASVVDVLSDFFSSAQPALTPSHVIERAVSSLRRVLWMLSLTTEEIVAFHFIVCHVQLATAATAAVDESTTSGLLDVSTASSLLNASTASLADKSAAFGGASLTQNAVSPVVGGKQAAMLVPLFYCNLEDPASVLTAVVCGLSLFCSEHRKDTSVLEMQYQHTGLSLLSHMLRLALLHFRCVRDAGVFFVDEAVVSGADLITALSDHGAFDSLPRTPRTGPEHVTQTLIIPAHALDTSASTLRDRLGFELTQPAPVPAFTSLYDSADSNRGPPPFAVAHLLRSSPAHVAGMRKHDMIVSINGRNVEACRFEDVVQLLLTPLPHTEAVASAEELQHVGPDDIVLGVRRTIRRRVTFPPPLAQRQNAQAIATQLLHAGVLVPAGKTAEEAAAAATAAAATQTSSPSSSSSSSRPDTRSSQPRTAAAPSAHRNDGTPRSATQLPHNHNHQQLQQRQLQRQRLRVEDRAKALYRFSVDAVLLGKLKLHTGFGESGKGSAHKGQRSDAGRRRSHLHSLQTCVKRVLMMLLTGSLPSYVDEECVKLQLQHVLLRKADDPFAHVFMEHMLGYS